jgi:hypothetical protein
MEEPPIATETIMKLWIPFAIGGVILIAYALFYVITAEEGQGGNSIGIANSVGLIGVFVAIIAAGFILRRATPHQ